MIGCRVSLIARVDFCLRNCGVLSPLIRNGVTFIDITAVYTFAGKQRNGFVTRVSHISWLLPQGTRGVWGLTPHIVTFSHDATRTNNPNNYLDY